MPLPTREALATEKDYWALPEDVRAELIDGEMRMLAAPGRAHQRIVLELGRALANFIDAHGGPCEVDVAPFAVNLFGDGSTIVEPDVSVVCDRSRLSERGCEGAPDLVAEVASPSDPNRDYVSKLRLYRDAGVREYWVVDPQEARTLTYVFGPEPAMGGYDFAEPVPSTVLPGFEMDFAAVMAAL